MVKSVTPATNDRIEEILAMSNGRRALNNALVDPRSYLKKSGWIESLANHNSEFKGEMIPWFNYTMVGFIAHRVRKTMNVFEYGSGFSTSWWERHAASVDAVEHSAEWIEEARKRLGDRATITHVALEYDGDYCRFIGTTGKTYDIVVVDGRDRINCMSHALSFMHDDAVFVFDNSQRPRYRDGIEALKTTGWKEIQLSGLTPMSVGERVTSILYRQNNCFDI